VTQSSPQPPNATVLVVDDNDANRALAQATLEDEGYRVVLATGGEEGVDAFVRERPDCVLLDVRMPGTDGFAVCERIRGQPSGSQTPVLFFTALRDVDTFDRALRAGGDDFLSKPVRPAELLVRVKSALTLVRVKGELHDHYALLKQQRDALQRVQLQKERMAAFIIHDLKNPVNTMDLHAQLLLREKGLSPGAQDSVVHIRREARQLGRMIMNLLDVSKGDEGKLTPRALDLDLRRLVDDVLAEIEVMALDREVILQARVTADAVFADDDLLRRTLINLIENAIRHAPTGTSVTVTATRSPHGVDLRVADAGAGVPEELRENVFSPFAQLESAERIVAHGTRGLGLTFCKMAAEAHGGRIWVEDAAPGAVFCVSLPDASSS
jgi:signal transduction histidine kinase